MKKYFPAFAINLFFSYGIEQELRLYVTYRRKQNYICSKQHICLTKRNLKDDKKG